MVRDRWLQNYHRNVVRCTTLVPCSRVVIVPDYNSRTGNSARVIGHSYTFGDLFAIIVVTEGGREYGANGWRANSKDHRIYQEQEQ
jgi:hypothetical protein